MSKSSRCSCFGIIISIQIVILAVVVFFTIPRIPNPPVFEDFEDGWFGVGEKHHQDPSIKQFSVSVSQDILDDLKLRLVNTRFTDSLEGVQWEYGTNMKYVKELADYWANNYDWRKHEKVLNSLPQFQTNIDGLKVHFLHVKPTVKPGQTPVPIMFIHGWPGSFYEFYKVVPLLTQASESGKFAYEIVCPSIAGYGFSEAPQKQGFTAINAAVMFSKLMIRLGHESYYVQGGDWGSDIARIMAIINKRHVKAIHLNMFQSNPPYGPWSFLLGYFTMVPREHKKIFPLKDYFFGLLRETGYAHIQATRPDSIAVSLANSPAGLASYIIEKFFVASGCKLNDTSVCLENCFTKDELITNLMIYWVTNSMTTAMRFYKENFPNSQKWEVMSIPIDIPSGIAEFPNEPFLPPKPFVLASFPNNVQYSVIAKGGHFAAFEQPELFAKDVASFVEKVEGMSSKQE